MTMNAPAVSPGVGELMEAVIVRGDLAKLSSHERTQYYMQVCKSIGLNPLTRPFDYLTLNGKLILYARRDAADQLRKLHNVNVEIVSHAVHDGLLTVHAKATDKTGRIDEDFGVVSIAGLRGEFAANAFLKAVTKSKRRVTLSICGLGWLDETEVADLPADVAAPVDIDPETGELPPRQIDQDRATPDNDEPAKVLGREAAMRGKAILKVWTEGLDREVRARLKPYIMRELLPIAEAVDGDGAKAPKRQKKPEPETESRDEAGQDRTDPANVGGSSSVTSPSPGGELPIDDMRDVFPPDRQQR
jgi:hypothetical protein